MTSIASVSTTSSRLNVGLRSRLKAGGIHLAISAGIALLAVALVFGLWYPSPLDQVSGVGQILTLILVVDVILGPLLTVVVYKRGKKSLKFDLALIAMLQIAALGYGLKTIEAGRPLFLVFTVDRFEVISRSDLRAEDLKFGTSNPASSISWFGPQTIGVTNPDSIEEQQRIMTESVTGGRDLQHYPHLYRKYDRMTNAVLEKGQSIAQLRVLNPLALSVLDETLAVLERDDSQIRFLPVRGFRDDAAMLIDAQTGEPLRMLALKPW